VAGYRTISFLSDYGSVDEFAGVCRSVIADLAPEVTVIDITHEIPPHDIRAGSLTLVRAVQYLPEGVVLAVVDPGVATQRRGLAVEVAGGRGVFVGPDNGLLAPAVSLAGGATRAVEITDPRFGLPAPGPTFAGRDVFAPAAAHLCRGVELTELGPAVEPSSLVPGVVPLASVDDTGIDAEVLWVDRFGNAQLNVGPDDIAHLGDPIHLVIEGRPRTATAAYTYDEIPPGGIGLVIDSYGLVSLASARSSAAAELGLDAGSGVRLEEPSDGDRGADPTSTPVHLHPKPRPDTGR